MPDAGGGIGDSGAGVGPERIEFQENGTLIGGGGTRTADRTKGGIPFAAESGNVDAHRFAGGAAFDYLPGLRLLPPIDGTYPPEAPNQNGEIGKGVHSGRDAVAHGSIFAHPLGRTCYSIAS